MTTADPSEPTDSESVVIRGSLPAEEFLLAETIRTLPAVEFTCEPVVESGVDTLLPMVRAHGADSADLAAALDADPDVERATLVAAFDDGGLFRVDWGSNVQLLVQMITNSQATILDLSSRGNRWSLRVLYPSREDLATTASFCERHELSFEVESIRSFDGGTGGRYGLTAEQYETLRVAWERGYFRIPREADLSDLGEELGLSHQAVSERLRRGHEQLLENVLIGDPSTDERAE